MERAERGGPPITMRAPGAPGLDVRPVVAHATVAFSTPRHAMTLDLDVDPRFGPQRAVDLLLEAEIEAPGGDPVLRAGADHDLRSARALLHDLALAERPEAEKVDAIVGFVNRAIYHATVTGESTGGHRWLAWRSRSPRPAGPEELDWFGLARSVGAGLCGRQAGIAHGLFCAAGLRSRVWRIKAPAGGPPSGHVVNEVCVDGVWRHVDISYRGTYLDRTGRPAAMDQLAADRALIDRAPTYADEEIAHWALDVSKEACHELLVSYYLSPETNTIGWDSDRAVPSSPPAPARPLRRGERRVYRWDAPPERWGTVATADPAIARRDPYHAAATHRGAFGEVGRVWAVDLAAAPREAHALDELAVDTTGDAPRLVKPAGPGEGRLAYRLDAPHLHTALRVDGAVAFATPGTAELALSFDGGASFASTVALTPGPLAVDLDAAVTARTDVVVMIRLAGAGEASIDALRIVTAELVNPRGLPDLRPGPNRVAYADDGPPGPRTARVTYARDVGIAFAPAEPRTGDLVTITGRVRNSGPQAARGVPVEIRLDDPFDGALVAARIVDVPEEGAAEIDFTWDTAGRFGAFDVHLVVDPDRALRDRARLVARRSIVVRRGPWLQAPSSFLRREADVVAVDLIAQGDIDATDVRVELFSGVPGDDATPFAERTIDRIERTKHVCVRVRPAAPVAEVGARIVMDGWAWTLNGQDAAPERLSTHAGFRCTIEPETDAAGALFDGDLRTSARWVPRASTPVVIAMTWDDPVTVGRAVLRYGDFGTALPDGAERFEVLTARGWRPLEQERRVDGGIFSEHWFSPRPGRGVRLIVEGPARHAGPVVVRDLCLEPRPDVGVRPWPGRRAPDRAVQ